MAGIDGDEISRGAWDTYGSPGERRAYQAGRESVMSDHEGRLRALETGQAAMQQTLGTLGATLSEVQREAHATRIEQNSALGQISTKLEAMAMAAAEARGAQAEAAKQAKTAADRDREARERDAAAANTRRSWAIALTGPAILLALWIGAHWVDDQIDPPPMLGSTP